MKINTLILLLILEYVICSQQNCQCFNVLERAICEGSGYCLWKDEQCINNLNLKLENQTKCSQLEKVKCLKNYNCVFLNEQCTQFTSCEILTDCESSINCIWNGKICIPHNFCQNFQSQIDCQKQIQKGNYCFWDQYASPQCQMIAACNLLPQLKSHLLCSKALIFCTIDDLGYCQNKLQSCIQYKEYQCFETINRIQCEWNVNFKTCQEKICENGKFYTDNDCKQYLEECTTNGKNCIQRKDCNQIMNVQGCVTDQNNNRCFWTGFSCIQQICSEIPYEQKCTSYFLDLKCTATQLGYCKELPQNCEGYETKQSCNVDSQNMECFWQNGICLQKTCSHAPQNYDCQLWKNDNSCMNGVNGFCVDKPQFCNQIMDNSQCQLIQLQNQICQQQTCSIAHCSKAPKNYISHQLCENWSIECTVNILEAGCLKKFQFCDQYQHQEQCKSTLDGSECIFRDLKCQLKLCEYGQFQSNEECQIWNKNCVYSEQQLKCIEWPTYCNQLLSEQQCNFGLQDGSYCNWTNAGCIDQLNQTQCVDATNSKDFNIHAKCNKWNSNCTVISNVGSCAPRQNCEDYNNSNQCIVGIDGQQCTWDGIQCLNKCKQQGLETLDYQVCQILDTSCTLNDLTANCIEKLNCSDYLNEQNCKNDLNSLPCKWDNNTQSCSNKVCQDFLDAIYENQCTYFLEYQICQLNINGIGCIQRPLQCSEITDENICFNTIPQNKFNYCYFSSGICIEINEFQCDQIINFPSSTDDCSKYNNLCVFNSIVGCVNKYSCQQLSSLQCEADSSVSLCILNNGDTILLKACQNSSNNIDCSMISSEIINCPLEEGNFPQRQCSDLDGQFNQFIQSFLYVDGLQCRGTVFQSFLNDLDQSQCEIGHQFTGLKCDCTNDNQCKKLQCSQIQNNCLLWNNECIEENQQCVEIQSCENIYTELQCQLAYNKKLKCLWLNYQCYNHFPCDALFANNYTEQQCIQYGLCKLNTKSSGCEYKNCLEYTLMDYCEQLENCSWNLFLGKCTIKNICQSQTLESDCQNISGCFWDGTQCIIEYCSHAQSENECFVIVLQNNQKCLWFNSSCQDAYQCSDIADPLNPNDCLNYGCVINYQFSDNSNYCQTKKPSCVQYNNQHACTFDIKNNKCQWDKITQQCLNIQCQIYISNNGQYDNKICQQFNSDCVVNLSYTGCRQKLTNCYDYLNQNQCLLARNQQNEYCYWDGSQCIDAECSQYNSLLQPSLSCFEYAQCTQLNGICTDSLISCNSYSNEIQCNQSQDQAGNFCGWVNNSCQQKSCNNYPFSAINHIDCQGWLQSCTSNSYNSKCIQIVDCTSAPSEIDSLNKCELFISPTNEICTISEMQGGCIDLPQTCNLASKTQCYIDDNKIKCYWSEQDQICKDLNCSNIDITVNTALECESILNSCTISSLGYGCQVKQSCSDYSINECQMLNIRDQNNRSCISGCQQIVCEDYLYQTDILCQSVLDGSCINNGQQCINHYTCADFTFQNQCQISKQGIQCFWLNDQNKCVEKQCNHADESYNNNELCQQFLLKCNYSEIKKQCTDKLNCYEYDKQELCYLDRNDQLCIWHDNYCYDATCIHICGDGILDIENEQCDDGNLVQYDGCHLCQFSCVIGCLICNQGICLECDSQLGYYLDQQNTCISQCGDQIVQGNEQCDDGNLDQFDGCYDCQYQCHFACKQCIEGICYECQDGWPSSFNNQCEVICGDGYFVNKQMITNSNQIIEQCDDGNLQNLDGCSDKCQIEENWFCFNNLENLSVCDIYDQTKMILTLLTQKPNIKQEVLVTFSRALKLVDNTKQLLLNANLLASDNSSYNITIISVQEPSKNKFFYIKYLIIITFFVNFEHPILQVKFDNTKTIDQKDLFPTNQKQSIGLNSIYCESEFEIQVLASTKTTNQIMLFILIAIAIIAILSQNLEILWNLLDLIQYLSYIKYINIEFPQNLNNYFEVFNMITLQPAINFLRLESFVNLLNYGQNIEIETTNKFKLDNINAFYFYNFTSSLLIFGVSFLLYTLCLQGLNILFKIQSRFQKKIVILKFLALVQKGFSQFVTYFFYSGIIRTFLANSYDLLFTIFLQLYYPQFDQLLKTISVIVSAISLSFILQLIIWIISIQSNRSYSQMKKFSVLSEENRKSNGQFVKQFHSILLIKKLAFMGILIFMQKTGEVQTLCISLTHIIFSLYLFQVNPIKNKFELVKNIFVETSIGFSTCLFIFYCLPVLSIEQKYRIGWVHISVFTIVLCFTVIKTILVENLPAILKKGKKKIECLSISIDTSLKTRDFLSMRCSFFGYLYLPQYYVTLIILIFIYVQNLILFNRQSPKKLVSSKKLYVLK